MGTLDTFDRLLAEAHRRGLKLIVDLVCGHTSDSHPWFAESRRSKQADRADWYVWADPAPDGTAPNNWLSVFGGPAWTWDPRRRQYYLHHFLPGQPTLNLRNPAVVAELLDTARFWLERGVDGFRLDAVDFLMHDPQLRGQSADAGLSRPGFRPSRSVFSGISTTWRMPIPPACWPNSARSWTSMAAGCCWASCRASREPASGSTAIPDRASCIPPIPSTCPSSRSMPAPCIPH